jgi:beta-lactamase class A
MSVLLMSLAGPLLSAWAGKSYPLLQDCLDQKLQMKVEQIIEKLQLKEASQKKQLSVVLVDITDLKRPRLASINGNEMMYAASLPKLAILLAAFVQIEEGQMVLSPKTRKTMTSMIRDSSNMAATEMFRRVGPERIAETLQSPEYMLYDVKGDGGLWCGKEYGQGDAWRRDPLARLSHAATAMQTARFYYLLETRQLVNPTLTQEMKVMLSKPGLQHKFVKGLQARPGVQIYRKSGTWRKWHADSALVEYKRYRYIIAALAAHRKGNKWLERLAAPLHDLIVPRSPVLLRSHH